MTIRWFESNSDAALKKWKDIDSLDDKLLVSEDDI